MRRLIQSVLFTYFSASELESTRLADWFQSKQFSTENKCCCLNSRSLLLLTTKDIHSACTKSAPVHSDSLSRDPAESGITPEKKAVKQKRKRVCA